MCPNVHCSTVYSIQNMEAAYVSISRQMDKKAVVHIHSAIKKNTFESVLIRWMKLDPIIQSEVSQKEKQTFLQRRHTDG